MGLVLFSGGLDSTLATIMIASKNVDLISFSIDFPGRPRGENVADDDRFVASDSCVRDDQ